MLRFMKKGYKPRGYAIKGGKRKHVPKSQRAIITADFLQQHFWGGKSKISDEDLEKPRNRKQLATWDSVGKTSITTLSELNRAISKLKTSMAPDPDDIPSEYIKFLSTENPMEILGIVNTWYQDKVVPPEDLRAKVVMIFKERQHKPSQLPSNFVVKHLPSLSWIERAVSSKRLRLQTQMTSLRNT